MDDLNGLFSASPASPVPQASPMASPGLIVPPVSATPSVMMPIIPTQTTAAEQLNNKTQILNQFQQPVAMGAVMGGPPGRAAPSLPGPVPPQPSSLQPPTSSDSLTLSSSFTEPGPVEFDDNFFGSLTPAQDSVDGGSDFFIGENEASPRIIENKEGEAKLEEIQAEETKGGEGQSKEAEPTERKTSFWSGLWSRNKDHGSKENILDESDKKTSEQKTEEGRGGNEQKFLGEGQTFKGKLIGVLEVKEARGDRMCQDALQELKMAIKASGEHKQKVNIQIAVDGLKIRDEKSGDCLYHHPVHKISFIAQDMTDNRAFGYVYGSPENGHRFFGIKTEKAAGQVVVAMRDLFQVVFEMKKKEIDDAKQSMETESLMNDPSKVTSSAASFPDGPAAPLGVVGDLGAASAPVGGNRSNNAIDDLLGLQTELSAIQAGIQQIDKIAPSPPMSFQTESMMPLHLSMSPQQQQQPHLAPVGRINDKKPVAVMNQNPPVSEFSTAPFLPPPPSKPGRRQDDRYAVFDNVQRYAHNNNILQQQTNSLPPAPAPAPPAAAGNSGLGSAFGDEGPPSIFSQSLGFSDGPGAPIFSQAPPPQLQQQLVQQPPRQQMGPVGVNKSGSQDLASLFTDLDPLGTGKSKPFVDKKDFFTDSKTAMKLTGASSDSMNNVGLNLSDFVDSNPGYTVPQSHYTNSVLSSSSCLSSRYSDSLWCSSPPVSETPRSLDHQLGTVSYCRPPPVTRIQAETWGSSQSSHRSSNTLRVALPPEDQARSVSPAINSQTSNNYGSILELEASPRRFRKQEIPDFYSTTPDSLSSYPYGRYGAESDSIDSNIPIPSEPPPALPKRPPKLSSASPPPLPPKKQSVVSCSLRSETQPETTSDIYDFIHENTESGGLVEEVAVEDLVSMSVVELSQKMMEGKLPPHLSGMSLFQLVEFISKQTKSEDSARSQEETSELKPSFSDNFVAQNKHSSGTESSHSHQMESQNYLPDPNLSRLTPKSCESFTTNESRFPCSLSLHSNTQSEAGNVVAIPSSSGSQNKSGFEDDFSRFNPESTGRSLVEENKETEPYDKYAVFRELQMEEEISNAWMSPSEEIPEENKGALEISQETGETEPDFLDIQNVDIPAEDPEFYDEEQNYDQHETFYDTEQESQNQNFENPLQYEDKAEDKAEEEETVIDDINPDHPPLSLSDELTSDQKMGNGQAVILSPEVPTVPLPGEENTAFEDNFSAGFPDGSSDKSGWATFEDDKACEFSTFLSKEEQNSLLNNNGNLQQPRRESFSSDWEPAFYNRSKSTDPTTRGQDPNWQTNFDPFDGRPGTEPAKQWSNAWSDEAFQSSTSDSRDKVSENSEKNSEDSIFNNPFTDNFVSCSLSRAVSETPPMFEGEGQCDRISEQFFHCEEQADSALDVFDENNSFANSNFKIQAKTATNMTNSESVDIFKVNADPFDDEFFK